MLGPAQRSSYGRRWSSSGDAAILRRQRLTRRLIRSRDIVILWMDSV
jgi:hypothetical protein